MVDGPGSGAVDTVWNILILGALQWGLRQLFDDPGTQEQLRKAAEDLNGWLLGQRGCDVVGTDKQLGLRYAAPIRNEPPPPLHPQPEPPVTPGNLSKIDHIVVVMMENRSFDHILGYLSLPTSMGGKGRTDVDGLHGDELALTPDNRHATVFHITSGTRFEYDPGHGFKDVKLQRGEYQWPSAGFPSTPFFVGRNQGFVIDFAKRLASDFPGARQGLGSKATDIMGFYLGADLPTYELLADQFAICDHWYAAHPGHTWPNRFVSLTGQLALGPDGKPDAFNPELASFDPLETATIFDHLSKAGVSWRYYEKDFSMLRAFSRYTYDHENVISIDDPERLLRGRRQRGVAVGDVHRA